MRPARLVLIVSLVLGPAASVLAQESAATRPETRPATETAPASRPAEVRVRHPRIGVRCDAVALERQRVARVDEVAANSPAERAGVKVGDVIVKVGGDDIRDDKTYREALARRRPGESVTLVLRRGSDEFDVVVILPDKSTRVEPDSIVIQHCLVMCGEMASKQGKKRTVEEAKKLADEILLKAKNGADFAELVKSYSEDSGSVTRNPPGSYVLVGDGKPKPTTEAKEKREMVPGFSAVGFALEVGDVAMASYDSELSPFGFHVIKRIK